MFSSWVPFAVLMAIIGAALRLTSEYFKVQPIHMLLWMRLLAFIALSPVLFILPPPQVPLYYLFVVIASSLFAVVDIYTFGVSAKAGAGIATRIQPLEVVGTFMIWTAITPSLVADYIADQGRALGIIASLLLGVFFTLRLRRCTISRENLRIMAVPIAMAAIATVFSKSAMEQADNLHSGVFYYPLIQAAVVLSVYTLMLRLPFLKARTPNFDLSSKFFDKRVLIAGFCLAFLHICGSLTKYYGISLAENPAYVTMIYLTGPLWVLLVYRLVGRREEADVISGLGIVAAVAMLVYFVHI